MRFTLRELLLVTVIVGMGICWWSDHKRAIMARERGVSMFLLGNLLREEGYEVSIDNRGVELHHKKSGRIRYVGR